MPYISAQRRDELGYDDTVPETAGELNYVITAAVDNYLLLSPRSYGAINEAIGVLECAKLELYRRVAAPYEDRACERNGDVYTT